MKAEEIKTKNSKAISLQNYAIRDIINDHKAIRNESNELKIQINMHVNFISSKDTGETCAE